MITTLHQRLRELPGRKHLIDELLPQAVALLGDEFSTWIDGGAGIGHVSSKYASIIPEGGTLHCYEPLPENFRQLRAKCDGPKYVLHEAALSDRNGTSELVIPIRSAGGADWPAGTSWGGSLKFPANNDVVPVKTVRLDTEAIERFDFVKLDLQGGELDTLRGMGDRITEPKLMYVETQLLNDWQNTLGLLQEHGYVVFYDRMQIGMRSANCVDVGAFRELGISVDLMHLPHSCGLHFMCMAHFESDHAIDPQTGLFTPEAVDRLTSMGVHYLSSDIIAVNSRHWHRLSALL